MMFLFSLSGQEVVSSRCCEGSEVGLGGDVASGEGFSVSDLLDVAQAYCNPSVSVGVEGVEVDGDSRVAAGVDLAAIQDGSHMSVHNLGWVLGIGVEEEMASVGFIFTLGIPVT